VEHGGLSVDEGTSTTVGLGAVGAAFIGEAEERDLGQGSGEMRCDR